MLKTYFLAGLNEVHYTVMNRVISAGKKPGLLTDSVSLEIVNGTLYAGPHEFLFPCGVYGDQDTAAQITLADYNLTRSPVRSSWTICWEIDSNLVASPMLVLKRGILLQSDATKYQCVIGWLVYAGSSTELENSTMVPNIRETSVLLKVARPSADIVPRSIPSSVTVSEVVSGYKASLNLKNNSAETVTAELTVFGLSEDTTPGELIVSTATSDTGFSLSAEIVTETGAGISAGNTANLASGDGLVKLPLSYQQEYFSKWSPFGLNLYLRIPALGSVSINHVIVTDSPRLSVG